MDVAAGAVALMFGIFVLNRLMNITVLRSTVHKKGRIFPALCDDLICPKSYEWIWVEYKANALIYPLASCYGLQTIHRDNTALGKGHLEGRCIFEGPGVLLRSAQIGWIRF